MPEHVTLRSPVVGRRFVPTVVLVDELQAAKLEPMLAMLEAQIVEALDTGGPLATLRTLNGWDARMLAWHNALGMLIDIVEREGYDLSQVEPG